MRTSIEHRALTLTVTTPQCGSTFEEKPPIYGQTVFHKHHAKKDAEVL